jgi:uncharacterized OsmC-like protein
MTTRNQPVAVDSNLTSTRVRVATSGERARVLASFRGQHIVSDAPAYAGGPAEAAAPTELLLSALGGCALGMFDLVCARDEIPLKKCTVDIESEMGAPAENDAGVEVFDEITLKFIFEGISDEQAKTLVGIFHANCPIYGSLKLASGNVVTEFETR